MPKIRNVSPYGDLDVPLLGRVVKAGETVEVTTEQARVLLKQADNYTTPGQAKKPTKKAAQKAAPPKAEEPAHDEEKQA